jgi:hypothetical protein
MVGSGEPTTSEPRIEYRPHPDATPEAEVQALAAVYAFILKCHEQKKAADAVGDDADRPEDGHRGDPLEEYPTKDNSA